MTSVALACAAAALLCWPRPDRPVHARELRSGVAVLQLPVRTITGALAGTTAAVVGIGSSPLVAVVAAGAVLAAGRAAERRRTRTIAERRVGSLADALGGFAADLRAGRSVDESALAASRACADDETAEALARALRAPDGAPGPVAGEAPWEEAVSRIAAGVRLSLRTGCSLAAVACAVEDDLRSRVRQQQDLRTAVASPRASAALLAALPVLALAMGAGIGADPWHVLVATPVGNLLLLVGVALEAIGLTWSSRLVERALP